MATDKDAEKQFGKKPWPKNIMLDCGYCGKRPLRVCGVWHPSLTHHGSHADAYIVLGCFACGSTSNGGKA
jgi:hypothetical protein